MLTNLLDQEREFEGVDFSKNNAVLWTRRFISLVALQTNLTRCTLTPTCSRLVRRIYSIW